MEKKPLHLLILEDNPDDAELAVKELEWKGFTLEWSRVDTEKAFREAIEKKIDLILADNKVPSFNGLAALKIQQEIAPDIPLIIYSGTIGEEFAVECMKFGATDYVLKDRPFRLGPAVKRALEEAEEHRARKRAEELCFAPSGASTSSLPKKRIEIV
jgi:two-component system sensor kinase